MVDASLLYIAPIAIGWSVNLVLGPLTRCGIRAFRGWGIYYTAPFLRDTYIFQILTVVAGAAVGLVGT